MLSTSLTQVTPQCEVLQYHTKIVQCPLRASTRTFAEHRWDSPVCTSAYKEYFEATRVAMPSLKGIRFSVISSRFTVVLRTLDDPLFQVLRGDFVGHPMCKPITSADDKGMVDVLGYQVKYHLARNDDAGEQRHLISTKGRAEEVQAVRRGGQVHLHINGRMRTCKSFVT